MFIDEQADIANTVGAMRFWALSCNVDQLVACDFVFAFLVRGAAFLLIMLGESMLFMAHTSCAYRLAIIHWRRASVE